MAVQLIPLHTRSINEQTLDTVNARDLHTFLELGRDFNTWINARIKRYGFIEGEDFKCVENLSSPKWGSTKSRVQKVKDYFLTLDMAKELAMVERNDKGKQARRYFIDCEKQLHEQKQLPATTPNKALLETSFQETSFQETEKYQLLNDMVKAMKLESSPVVIPSKELVDLIQAVRMYQTQIAQLHTPDWVNDNITRVKDLAQRNFTDF
ncbi:Phage anti-repressor protein [Marinomonas polaris DSM 16579]|uniref:Phage anti-repressor protein n=1 Tax=Marinomonas polaris DSM 16579 TaxID=1122206 RepID=A0A1M5CR98_9GAMM|nr:antA/AntB antirepressor family protein [Marinomonas polaris]SHF57249.1 Phage anti-repressor protein [Marinomonas polaris DSM 16579]